MKTMKRSGPMHVLLVHPPVSSPAAPPWGPGRAAARIQGPQLTLETYDANLDFFLNFCLQRDRLEGFREKIESFSKSAGLAGAPSDTLALLSDLSANPEDWKKKIRGVNRILEILKTARFFEPGPLVSALKDLGDLLALASLAHHPSTIRWAGFSNPAVRDWSGAGRFAEDEKTNPFLPLCREALGPRIGRAHPTCVVLFVSGKDQVLAALTMARFIKKNHPRIHLSISGDPETCKGAAEYVDTLLPEKDMESLADLVSSLGGRPGPGVEDPDFGGMPLEAYLSPVLVLPVDDAAGSFPRQVARQARRYGAQGFVCRDPRVTPAFLNGPGERMGVDGRPVAVTLSCPLDPSAFSGDPGALSQTGVRVVRWQDPAGELKVLTGALWDISKAGIWNHVEMPPGVEGEVSRGLDHFAASNSNIVHSRTRRCFSDSPFPAPDVEEEKEAMVYTDVTRLPGRAFQRFLHDPVHLLLYVNRHGPEKVLRWRVREDLRSVYSLGENMAYHFVAPGELPEGYLDEICRMVEAGGSVGGKWVRYNLERAFLIAYVLEEGVIVANSSLKRPRQEYVDAVKRQSGLDLSRYLERGYTSVRPEYRGMGIGTKLLEGLTARVGDRKLFAIISEDNLATQKIALRNRTRRVAIYQSERSGKKIGIWIPEWMIEE